MGLTLREVRDEDLPLLFEQWADPVAVHMAAFTAPDHMDRDAFERRWSRLRADESVLTKSSSTTTTSPERSGPGATPASAR
jgi:RimJ/RimL family protein N-acetyltransferase